MCDQSQIQRGLCAKNQEEAQKVLFINGIMRFPLVLLYCLIGVGLAGYAINNPDFINFLAVDGSKPNYNLSFSLAMFPYSMLFTWYCNPFLDRFKFEYVEKNIKF